ncbi:MAG: efflux RND transporter periplasmic adaptor subunit [Alphaproteobacteria bacterium]|nr:MAG: efflux RND transporter periplasmic adaptor subunit [Alphaproteobacteria bacterium]
MGHIQGGRCMADTRKKTGTASGMRWWILGGVVVVAAGWWFFIRKDAEVAPAGGPQGGGIAVEVVKATQGPIAETLEVAGQVDASSGVELRSEVTGRVVALRFTDGASVKKGNALVVLDDSVQRATLAQADAASALAEANVGRYQRLVEVGAASRLQVDQAVAQAKLEKANIQMAQANLAKFRIAAPFDGATGIAQVSVGDLVQPGELLVALTDNAQMKITFKVPEVQAASLQVGAPVTVRVDNGTDRTSPTVIEGEIAALDGRVDPASRTLQGKVLLDNKDGVLVSGQFVRVRVPVRTADDAVVVPDSAIVPQGNGVFAYVITTGEEGRNMASRTTVEVGLRTANKAQIVKGVQAGQQVVTAGHQKLQGPLMPVQLRSPTEVTVSPQAVEELQ